MRNGSFEKRVLPELPGLLRTCSCLTANPEQVARLVKDSIAETRRIWPTLRREFAGRTPVYSVLTEQYLKSQPTGSRLSFFYPTDESVSDLLSDQSSQISTTWPDVTMNATLPEANVRLAMLSLPPATRLVTALKMVRGFSYEEIEDIVGVPVEIVSTWLNQGRILLQQALLARSNASTNTHWTANTVSGTDD